MLQTSRISVVLVLLTVLIFSCKEDRGNKLIGGFPSEFIERNDGYNELSKYYDFKLSEVLEIDPGLMYDAVNNGKVDIISGFATDGRIQAYNLTILKDDKHFFPPYFAAPLINKATIEKFPDIVEILNKLGGVMTDIEMSELNAKVDLEGKLPELVAKEFLKSKGFKINKSNDNKNIADFLIGSKNFTESYILAIMFEILIENYTNLNPETKLGLGGTKIAFEALKNNEIGIYPEYTGTALQTLIEISPKELESMIRDSDAVYNHVNKILQKTSNVQFLKPVGINNTFVMAMQTERAKKLGLAKLSDLSKLKEFQ